jgi:Protein of unknown function, DUF547
MRFSISEFKLQTIVLGLALATVAPLAQESTVDARRRNLEQVLDLYVRDGYVYYRALRQERRLLDAYLNGVAAASIDSASRDEQLAFWLNAYNALALRTVIDHAPIPQRSREYPPGSIRQIPGAFERLTHRVAGRMVTLDQIEQTILPGFKDPRVYFALGRGAVGSGRLRSEPFTGAGLERQLTEVANECVTHAQCVAIDRAQNKVMVSSIFSWREKEFSAAYGDKASPAFSSRSPIERAVLAFVEPRLLTTERDFLATNQFRVEFAPFDWSLNDLTGRGGQ